MTDRITRHHDIILEAINEYDQWMQDDDYDAQPVLDRIIKRMRERISIEIDPNLEGALHRGRLMPDNPDFIHWYTVGYKDAYGDVSYLKKKLHALREERDDLKRQASGPSYLDFITPDDVFDQGPDAVREWQSIKAGGTAGYKKE